MEKKDAKSRYISLDEIWPQERDYMSRPERYKYVRKLVDPEGCVFCHSRDIGIEFDSLCLYKTDLAMVILNKYPYNGGHTLVLPTRHCGDFNELKDDEFLVLNELLRRSTAIIRKVYNCQGLNLGMNHGKVAGAGIPEHLHWHIIPRWFGDTNFFPLIAETKVQPESLEQSYDKLKFEFDRLEKI